LHGDSSNIDLYLYDKDHSQFIYVENPNPYINKYYQYDEPTGSFIPYVPTLEDKIEHAYDDLPDCDEVPEFMKDLYEEVPNLVSFAEEVVEEPELYFFDEPS
jgi:hypothetical protein